MLQNTISKLAPRIVAFLIALAGVGLLSWQARQLYLQMTQLPSIATARPAPATLSAPLLQRLFGQSVGTAVATLQGVVLQGCVVADDPRQSHALLRIEGQGALNVAPGEEFLPGVTLQAIAHDHVLILRNGSTARLDFPTAAPQGDTTAGNAG